MGKTSDIRYMGSWPFGAGSEEVIMDPVVMIVDNSRGYLFYGTGGGIYIFDLKKVVKIE